MRGFWVVACFSIALACSGRSMDSGAKRWPADSSVGQSVELVTAGREWIPAEWTVAEDTSETGDVITESLQLPAAKSIGGLLEAEDPQLVLRCVDGTVEAYIVTESPEAVGADLDSTATGGQLAQIQLDSPPKCE